MLNKNKYSKVSTNFSKIPNCYGLNFGYFIFSSLPYILKSNIKSSKFFLLILALANKKKLRFLCLHKKAWLLSLNTCLKYKININKLCCYLKKKKFPRKNRIAHFCFTVQSIKSRRKVSIANSSKFFRKRNKINKFYKAKLKRKKFFSVYLIKKKKRVGRKGILYIHLKKKNVVCTLLDYKRKKVKANCSLGMMSPKEENLNLLTDYDRVSNMMSFFLQKIKQFKYNKYIVIFVGRGSLKGVNASIGKALRTNKVSVCNFLNTTLLPHNGCRLSKKRRKKFRTKINYKTAKTIFGL